MNLVHRIWTRLALVVSAATFGAGCLLSGSTDMSRCDDFDAERVAPTVACTADGHGISYSTPTSCDLKTGVHYDTGVHDCGPTAMCAGTCNGPACVQTCKDDASCPSDKKCMRGLCTKGEGCGGNDAPCAADTDCRGGLSCRGGSCLAPCTDDAGCPSNLYCSKGGCRGRAIEGQACDSDIQCPLGMSCVPAYPNQGTVCARPCPDGGACGEYKTCAQGFCFSK